MQAVELTGHSGIVVKVCSIPGIALAMLRLLRTADGTHGSAPGGRFLSESLPVLIYFQKRISCPSNMSVPVITTPPPKKLLQESPQIDASRRNFVWGTLAAGSAAVSAATLSIPYVSTAQAQGLDPVKTGVRIHY